MVQSYNLTKLDPSPLKQALLRLVAKLLRKILTLHVTESSEVGTQESLDMCLNSLKELHEEMNKLMEEEAKESLFSSYLQQLVDVLVTADSLRPFDQRICSNFEFKSETTKAPEKKVEPVPVEEAQPQMWSCSMCTFENPDFSDQCEICGTARPPKLVKKSKRVWMLAV